MDFCRQYSQGILKTIIDYLITIICLILLIPVILILVITMKITGKGPVIYSQKRVGRFGKSFKIYKFRSMRMGTEEGLPLISDRKDKRITTLGRFMRKHKFDEIPNFINVLKGEMSLVGPRPEQKYYVEQILLKAPQFQLLQEIKPGITSWGQVKYGYASNIDEMIERLDYDLFYLENRSIWFDLKVLFHTIGIIIKGEGM
jgi:lipopolysaccharide/colanic/teichoic acid biosynthesis glycosyltransferase